MTDSLDLLAAATRPLEGLEGLPIPLLMTLVSPVEAPEDLGHIDPKLHYLKGFKASKLKLWP